MTQRTVNSDPEIFGLKHLVCSFLPKFSIHIETKYEDNNGFNDNIFDEPRDEDTEVCFIDIAYDEIPERYFKESEVRHQYSTVCYMKGYHQE
ncbi:cytoplasmic phosphatidylinositol transfer protein 1 isoform X1, partial [Tachysurus ichikawai]